MINIAARATNGVKIPNRKDARKQIIELFKRNLSSLRERLTVRLDFLHTLLMSSILIFLL